MFQSLMNVLLGAALGCVLAMSSCFGQQADVSSAGPEVAKSEVGAIPNVHRSGDLILSGQFAPDDIGLLQGDGVDRVISLRNADETTFDESEIVTGAGIEHVRIPFASEESLTDDVFDKVRGLLKDQQKTLLHCGSANRVGGVWLPYRVLDQGVDVATALKEAKRIGLKTPFIERKALDYIARKKKLTETQEASGEAAKGDADVTFVKAIQTGDQRWKFEVTVNHRDTGWEDYANGWDVVLPDGNVILVSPNDKFTRPLAHPHVNEQPFTRTQQNLLIPTGTPSVTVRAHDLVDHYGGKVVKVLLDQTEGENFAVVR